VTGLILVRASLMFLAWPRRLAGRAGPREIRRAGSSPAATWARAERIFDDIDHPRGQQVRAKLHGAALRR
jgi:hypothetical protein